MHDLQAVLTFLTPWEFAPGVLILCLGSVLLYLRGLWRTPEGAGESLGRRIAFFTGWALVYFVMQTHYDYLSQHMFFVHRIQHLVLHHLGPFLIVLSQPLPVLARGLPDGFVARVLRPVWRHPVTRFFYHLLQNWLVAPVLFVGLIYLWLYPPIHFDAMLSTPLYWLMNWSMLIDGLLFWSLMLDPRSKREGALLSFGVRLWIVLLAILPQIYIGWHIALARTELYVSYSVCGRAWPMSPIADQSLGGLITWVPAGMMHLIGVLIILGRWMRTDGGTVPETRRTAQINASQG